MDGGWDYRTDYYAWTHEQGRLLSQESERHGAGPLDYRNLAWEVFNLGRAQKRAVQWALTRILENLIKLMRDDDAARRDRWRDKVTTSRYVILGHLDQSPSLRGELDLVRAYRDGRRMARVDLQLADTQALSIPRECPFTLDMALGEDWWPEGSAP